jgi:hypothetical protein
MPPGAVVLRVAASKLPDGLYGALVERAGREGVSVSKLVRVAVQSYLGLPPQPRGSDVAGGGFEGLSGRLAELERRVSTLELAVSKPQGGREVEGWKRG